MIFILMSLNPCFSGQWSRTNTGEYVETTTNECLNPYCSGQ